MKILVDMNLSPEWVEVLQQAGFTAIHWSAVGKANAQDTELLAGSAGGALRRRGSRAGAADSQAILMTRKRPDPCGPGRFDLEPAFFK